MEPILVFLPVILDFDSLAQSTINPEMEPPISTFTDVMSYVKKIGAIISLSLISLLSSLLSFGCHFKLHEKAKITSISIMNTFACMSLVRVRQKLLTILWSRWSLEFPKLNRRFLRCIWQTSSVVGSSYYFLFCMLDNCFFFFFLFSKLWALFRRWKKYLKGQIILMRAAFLCV